MAQSGGYLCIFLKKLNNPSFFHYLLGSDVVKILCEKSVLTIIFYSRCVDSYLYLIYLVVDYTYTVERLTQ